MRKPRGRRPPSSAVKEAADRAERRAKGLPEDEPAAPIDPEIESSGIRDPRYGSRRAVAPTRKTKGKVGRPSAYGEKWAEAICKHIACGRSLRSFCAKDGHPHIDTVRKWLRKHDEFVVQYVRAREDQAESFVDEIPDIADEEEDSAKARVRIEARKWVAGKMKPKKYGEKIEVDGVVAIETEGRDMVDRGRRLVLLLEQLMVAGQQKIIDVTPEAP